MTACHFVASFASVDRGNDAIRFYRESILFLMRFLVTLFYSRVRVFPSLRDWNSQVGLCCLGSQAREGGGRKIWNGGMRRG